VHNAQIKSLFISLSPSLALLDAFQRGGNFNGKRKLPLLIYVARAVIFFINVVVHKFYAF
jgi:hypothetical protein